MIHRDLKPHNLLLSEPGENAVLKIADFGFARALEENKMAETLCGTPLYMAPEVLKGEHYGAKADLWSVGAILYEMVCGEPPFTASTHVMLLQKIESKPVAFPKDVHLSDDLKV